MEQSWIEVPSPWGEGQDEGMTRALPLTLTRLAVGYPGRTRHGEAAEALPKERESRTKNCRNDHIHSYS
jgi:hypothetical protein